MPTIGSNSKPAYVYDSGTDTWIPIGPGEHTHDYASSAHNHDSTYIAKTLTTTTGDIIYASAANTPARLGIGSTGQVLTVSGGLPVWTTSTAGMTLIATTTWDNTVGTYTYSSLGSYKHLLFVGQNLQHGNAAAQSEWQMRFNGSSGSNYGYSLMQMNGTTYSGSAAPNQTTAIALSVPAGSMLGSQGNANANLKGGECQIFIPDYGSSQFKGVYWTGGSAQDGTRCMTQATGRWCSVDPITSITIYMVTGNFYAGTMRLYGIS